MRVDGIPSVARVQQIHCTLALLQKQRVHGEHPCFVPFQLVHAGGIHRINGHVKRDGSARAVAHRKKIRRTAHLAAEGAASFVRSRRTSDGGRERPLRTRKRLVGCLRRRRNRTAVRVEMRTRDRCGGRGTNCRNAAWIVHEPSVDVQWNPSTRLQPEACRIGAFETSEKVEGKRDEAN